MAQRRGKDFGERKHALSELGEIAGTVLHELRNPLGVIESSIYLIRKQPDDVEKRDKHLERIAEQVQHAKAVIAGLLDLLRDVPLHTEVLDVATLVHASVPAVETIEFGALDVPPIRGDATLLGQALRNLADNAARWARTKVRVEARANEGFVEISVEDDGPGVPDALLPHLFQPLATGRADGTGLGLSLCRRIAVRHDGSLRYEPCGGARFILSIPFAS